VTIQVINSRSLFFLPFLFERTDMLCLLRLSYLADILPFVTSDKTQAFKRKLKFQKICIHLKSVALIRSVSTFGRSEEFNEPLFLK